MNKEKKKKETKKKNRVGLLIFLIILVALGIAAGVFFVKVEKNGGGVQGIVATALGHDEETVQKLDTYYCVLLGQSQNLTDTIILAAYNPGTQKASMLSIPRDTFVGKNKNNGQPEDKINALCQYKHPEKTVKAVSEVTGVDVEKYLLVDTKALIKAVDLIGGVYFDVPIDMKYTDETQDLYIDLKKGYQLLDGDKAEQVVRFRHNDNGTTYPTEYGTEDIGREKTQRAFLTELAKQTFQPQNIFKIQEFIDIFYENVKTNIEMDEIKDYIPYIVNFKTENLKTGMLQGTSERYSTGYWFFTADKEATAKEVKRVFGKIESNIEDVSVQILNGTGDKDVLDEVIAKIEKEGYDVVSSEETSETMRTSIINRNESKEEYTKKIRDLLGVGVRTSGENEEGIDVTIIIGKDYTKLQNVNE